MSSGRYTNRQAAFQWLIGELLREYSRTNDFAVVHEMLESLSEFERESVLGSLFWYAVDHVEWELAEHCVRDGYQLAPDTNDISDYGPLHDAMSLLGDRADVIDWLLRHGAPVDRRGFNNVTPLIYAAAVGFDEISTALVEHGADVNAATIIDDDETALMCAATEGHEAIVRLLLAHGADARGRNRWGKTAADLAEERGEDEIVRLLRAAARI